MRIRHAGGKYQDHKISQEHPLHSRTDGLVAERRNCIANELE